MIQSSAGLHETRAESTWTGLFNHANPFPETLCITKLNSCGNMLIRSARTKNLGWAYGNQKTAYPYRGRGERGLADMD